MERLEGGLEKLKSTAAQVDDLKEKLAAQEVELKQKNDDADALIKRVGVETEKVEQECLMTILVINCQIHHALACPCMLNETGSGECVCVCVWGGGGGVGLLGARIFYKKK